MNFRPLWHHAAAMSARWHRNQYRKDGKTPYASHPFRVAMTVALIFGNEDESILAGALLHDVIEDCDIDYDEVRRHFGATIADYVAVMSKDMRLPAHIREDAYDRQLAEGPWQGRLIKLADVYDNLSDARTEDGKRKIIDKANRALHLAEHDEACAVARDKLRELMAKIEQEMHIGT
jgi:(p)ppGpp synthase/HD superfamily hydrolase